MRSLLHRLRNWFAMLGGSDVFVPMATVWAGCLCGIVLTVGCAALSKPALGPDGQPKTGPTGEPVTVYDEVVGTGGTLASLLGGNPLWGTIFGAAGLLLKDKVVKKGGAAPGGSTSPPGTTPVPS